MSKLIFKISVVVLVGILTILSLRTTAQSKDHAEEKMKADAMAFAYADCDHALAKYYLNLDPERKDLKKKFKESNILRGQMTYNFDRWYKNEDDKKKLDREIKAAKKKLKRCIKFQNIMDASEEQDEQNTKSDQ